MMNCSTNRMLPPVKDAARHWSIHDKTRDIGHGFDHQRKRVLRSEPACEVSSYDGAADWIRARGEPNAATTIQAHMHPCSQDGMLNENPAADTEAHSVHTEASSLPIAELEAQLGQQVFMMVYLLMANSCQKCTHKQERHSGPARGLCTSDREMCPHRP